VSRQSRVVLCDPVHSTTSIPVPPGPVVSVLRASASSGACSTTDITSSLSPTGTMPAYSRLHSGVRQHGFTAP
jgi:hypothetical protein